jgi:hypothetical protein
MTEQKKRWSFGVALLLLFSLGIIDTFVETRNEMQRQQLERDRERKRAEEDALLKAMLDALIYDHRDYRSAGAFSLSRGMSSSSTVYADAKGAQLTQQNQEPKLTRRPCQDNRGTCHDHILPNT